MTEVNNVGCDAVAFECLEHLLVLIITYNVLFVNDQHVHIEDSLLNISHPVVVPIADVVMEDIVILFTRNPVTTFNFFFVC